MTKETEQVVDDFASGFAGTEVLGSATEDVPEEEMDVSDLISPPEGAVTEPVAAAAVNAPAPAVDAPAVATEPEVFSLTSEQYKDLANGLTELRASREETTRKLDTALGKIGGTERLMQQIQAATPKGEIPELTEADLGDLSKNFPHISEDLLPALNKALKNVKGTGGPAIVDPNVISSMVDERVAQALPAIQQKVKTELEQSMELDRVKAKHKDALQVFADPKFTAWGDALPAGEKEIYLNSWKADEMIPLIDKFKASIAPPAPKPAAAPNARTTAMKAAVTPKSAGGTGPKALTDDDQFEAGFAKELAATT